MTYHLISETTVNGSRVSLRKMYATNGETSYVIVAHTRNGDVYSNFSNRSVAESAYEAVALTARHA